MKALRMLGAVMLVLLTAGWTTGAALRGPTCGCQIHCPRCHCCLPEVEIEKVKKRCWEVECVAVCIPRVTFPWEYKKCGPGPCGEPCCPPAKPAKTRNVHILKAVEYECRECRYKWTPVCCEKCARTPQDLYLKPAAPLQPPPPPPPAAANRQ